MRVKEVKRANSRSRDTSERSKRNRRKKRDKRRRKRIKRGNILALDHEAEVATRRRKRRRRRSPRERDQNLGRNPIPRSVPDRKLYNQWRKAKFIGEESLGWAKSGVLFNCKT